MRNSRRALYFQLGGALLAGGCIFWLSHFLAIPEFVAAVQQRIVQWGFWSAICYPLLYAACNVLLLPGGVLTISGGFFFGLWWGFLIVLVGNVLGAALSFFLGRFAGDRWLRRRLLCHAAFAALEPAVERNGWKIILLSQIHPFFPTSLLNYLYGLTNIRFRTCMLWVAIGRMPGLFLYAYLGTLGQLGLNLLRGKTHLPAIECIIWGSGFISLILVIILLGRIALQLLEQIERSLQTQREDPCPAAVTTADSLA